jgi:hypothetical protein
MTLTMSVSDGGVEPGKSVKFRAQVSPTDCSGVRIDFGAIAFNDGQEGGHFHTGRPVGPMNPSSCVTDSNGQCYGEHPTGEFAGTDQLLATDGVASAHANLLVGYTNFVQLPDGDPRYVLEGGAPDHPLHPSNHWVTPEFKTALLNIITGYFAKFPQADPIEITDESLVFGGRFDIYGNWSGDHQFHRVGKNADIRMSSIPDANKAEFLKLCRTFGADPFPETSKNHWHLKFK